MNYAKRSSTGNVLSRRVHERDALISVAIYNNGKWQR